MPIGSVVAMQPARDSREQVKVRCDVWMRDIRSATNLDSRWRRDGWQINGKEEEDRTPVQRSLTRTRRGPRLPTFGTRTCRARLGLGGAQGSRNPFDHREELPFCS